MRPFVFASLILAGLASPAGAHPRREQVPAASAYAEISRHINQLAVAAARHGHHGLAQALLVTGGHVDEVFDPAKSAPLARGTKVNVTRQGDGSRFELPNGGHVLLWSGSVRVSEPPRDNTTRVHDIEVASALSLSRKRVLRADQSVVAGTTLLSIKGKDETVIESTIGGPEAAPQP